MCFTLRLSNYQYIPGRIPNIPLASLKLFFYLNTQYTIQDKGNTSSGRLMQGGGN
jgi:hypothetical protein